MSKVSKEVKVIVFRLQNEEYGVPIDYVGSIERMLEITRIPNTPKFIKGVINLRGIVTPSLIYVSVLVWKRVSILIGQE